MKKDLGFVQRTLRSCLRGALMRLDALGRRGLWGIWMVRDLPAALVRLLRSGTADALSAQRRQPPDRVVFVATACKNDPGHVRWARVVYRGAGLQPSETPVQIIDQQSGCASTRSTAGLKDWPRARRRALRTSRVIETSGRPPGERVCPGPSDEPNLCGDLPVPFGAHRCQAAALQTHTTPAENSDATQIEPMADTLGRRTQLGRGVGSGALPAGVDYDSLGYRHSETVLLLSSGSSFLHDALERARVVAPPERICTVGEPTWGSRISHT